MNKISMNKTILYKIKIKQKNKMGFRLVTYLRLKIRVVWGGVFFPLNSY